MKRGICNPTITNEPEPITGDYKPPGTKRLGQFLTTDYKSVETPNGRLRWVVDYELSSYRRPGGFEIRRKKRFDL